MSDQSQRPIVVRRRKVDAHGHHGGAWKIAYADFVTAMMAFFLLMWLLGSTAKGDLDGIAEFFRNPMKVSFAGGSGAGDSNSVIPGGGRDLTRRDGQVHHGEVLPSRVQDPDGAQAALERLELQRLLELQGRVEQAINDVPELQPFREQLLIDITPEGLRIQIVDKLNRPMFAVGRAELQPYAREILRRIAGALNGVPNKVSLSGHTDSTPYAGGELGYSNWELSADRANASRRELNAGGLQEGKVIRVLGLASSMLFKPENPGDPMNRRISIIVMNKRAEEAVVRNDTAVRGLLGEERGGHDNAEPGATPPARRF